MNHMVDIIHAGASRLVLRSLRIVLLLLLRHSGRRLYSSAQAHRKDALVTTEALQTAAEKARCPKVPNFLEQLASYTRFDSNFHGQALEIRSGQLSKS